MNVAAALPPLPYALPLAPGARTTAGRLLWQLPSYSTELLGNHGECTDVRCDSSHGVDDRRHQIRAHGRAHGHRQGRDSGGTSHVQCGRVIK